MSDRAPFLDRVAIAGVGMTELTHASGRSVLELALEASERALEDAGVEPAAVDGAISYGLFGDSVSAGSVAAAFGIRRLTFMQDLNLGGQAPCLAVATAAMAIEAGLASTVLVLRALNGRSGVRLGQHAAPIEGAEYRRRAGIFAFPQIYALWTQRYLHDVDAGEEALADVVVAQRAFAALNPAAIRRDPITAAQCAEGPYIAEPFRRHDCAVEVDGAGAVLVTSARRARTLRRRPVLVRGFAWAMDEPDIGTTNSFRYADYSRVFTAELAPRLWESAGVGPEQLDFAQVYDSFSGIVLPAIEGLGICGDGDAPAFYRDGHAGPGGSLPINTGGGMLAEGYLHGFNALTEGVRQLQGTAGERQIDGAALGVVVSGARSSGSALVLGAD